MKRTLVCLIAVAVLVTAWAAAACADSLPAQPTTTLVAKVWSQARLTVDATGRILSIFNTTDGSGAKPLILNVYRDGVKATITPQIAQQLDSISLKIDWSRGGVVYEAVK